MKHMTSLFAATLFMGGALGGTAFADPTGTWKTEEGNEGGFAIIAIETCADNAETYCGTIVELIDTPDQSGVGATIIKDMEARGATTFGSGQIWAPDEDRWYQAKMELDGDTLTVSGCVLGGLICRGQDWSRI